MDRFVPYTVVLLTGWCLFGTPATGQDRPVSEQPGLNAASWATEQVELLDGRRYSGFIESENDDWVHLMLIHRPSGRPMHLVIRTFDRASVADVLRLRPDQRASVRRRIDQFRNRARIEAGRMEAVRLETVSGADNRSHRYRGRWFTLESTAEPSTTRRIIVRIEQIFTAYRQILVPRTDAKRPLRLVVLNSMEEYHAYLGRLGLEIRSPACFIEGQNLIVAGSELSRYAAEMTKIDQRHGQLREDLQRLEKELAARLERIGRQLKQEGASRADVARLLTRERRKFEKQIQQKRIELKRCDRENARAFQNVTAQMFQRLYHEAFHAFLKNYVYPPPTHDVPLWLNEGLAVVLEGGLLESGMLRVDAPNPEALRLLKADLSLPWAPSLPWAHRAAEPLPLATVLAAGRQAFALDHDSDRYYAYSWGLAYYLTFEKHLLNSPALDTYVQQSAEGVSPSERFEKSVGLPLPEFEKQWREYIRQLR